MKAIPTIVLVTTLVFTIRRRVARVALFDNERRLLMIRAHDPAHPDRGSWWELPGGGIEGAEDPAEACARELGEEAGIDHRDVRIGPCVWVLHAEFDFGGWHFDQHEQILVATTDGPRTGPTALESLEALAFEEQRWWAVEDLMGSTERTIPYRLREVIADVAAGVYPDPPTDITAPPGYRW